MYKLLQGITHIVDVIDQANIPTLRQLKSNAEDLRDLFNVMLNLWTEYYERFQSNSLQSHSHYVTPLIEQGRRVGRHPFNITNNNCNTCVPCHSHGSILVRC